MCSSPAHELQIQTQDWCADAWRYSWATGQGMYQCIVWCRNRDPDIISGHVHCIERASCLISSHLSFCCRFRYTDQIHHCRSNRLVNIWGLAVCCRKIGCASSTSKDDARRKRRFYWILGDIDLDFISRINWAPLYMYLAKPYENRSKELVAVYLREQFT